jgi:hypothetical protein
MSLKDSVQEVNLAVLIKKMGVWNMVLSSAKGTTMKNKIRPDLTQFVSMPFTVPCSMDSTTSHTSTLSVYATLIYQVIFSF